MPTSWDCDWTTGRPFEEYCSNSEKQVGAWKPNYSVTPRKVVCAANRHRTKGIIICGARHWDKLMRAQVEALGEDYVSWDQGSIDQFGDWMGRKTAWNVALGQDQIRRAVGPEGTLFSENLY